MPPISIRHVKVGTVIVLATGLYAGNGCVQPARCPGNNGTPGGTAAPLTEAPYLGSGNPYAPGPLEIAVTRVAACERGNPVPLLLLAPRARGPYPVVVFQHGFMVRNENYTTILTHLASHGFVVVAPQMYEPTLAALLGRVKFTDEAALATELLDWLPGGLPDVLGYTPATDRLGLAGHSRGGMVAWLAARANPQRVLAIAGVDPVGRSGGPPKEQGNSAQASSTSPPPALIIGAELAGSCAPTGYNHEQFYAASGTPAWRVVMTGAGHADMLDESEARLASLVCESGHDRPTTRLLTAGLLVAFFRASLQGDDEGYAYLTDVARAPRTYEVESK